MLPCRLSLVFLRLSSVAPVVRTTTRVGDAPDHDFTGQGFLDHHIRKAMDQDSLDGLVSLPCFQAGRPVGKFGNLGDCGVHGGYEPRCRFRIASRLPFGASRMSSRAALSSRTIMTGQTAR